MCIVAEVLKEHRSKNYCVVFKDDNSIYSDRAVDYLHHVRAVMDTLHRYNFRLKDHKCTFE
jgi:hypothetical protein